MVKNIKLCFMKAREISPWITAACAAVLSGFASNVLWETFELWGTQFPGRFDFIKSLYLLLFVLSIILLYLQRDIIFRPRTRYLKDIENLEPRKHLVLFLSELNPYFSYECGIPDWLSLSADLEKDLNEMMRLKIENKVNRWNWEMPLRAIWYHKDVLESVTIICSDSKKSIGEVHNFFNICRHYEPISGVKFYLFKKSSPQMIAAPPEPQRVEDGFLFESFDELSEAMWSVLVELKRDGIAEDDIIIDFTGGQKVTSVVAATATFNRKIKAQYIQPGKDCRIIGFDVYFASSHTESLGI